MSLEVGLEVGADVWVPCRAQVWQPGVVVKLDATEDNGAPGSITVEIHGANGEAELVEIGQRAAKANAPPRLLLRNEVLKTRRGALASHDLARLPILHEAAILHALQERFESSVVYTSTGPVLIAVNPFRELVDLYSPARLQSYVDLPVGEDPANPHIFGIARAAYQGIQQHALPQTVLVSGESGAGKTETTKFVMRFLALAGAGCSEASMSVVERQVLESIPLLEALGNAKTLRNNNSSRFGKYIEMNFGLLAKSEKSEAPRLTGALLHTYLLEKVRVTSTQKGERSYHVFYQALAAAAREETRQPALSRAERRKRRGGEISIGDVKFSGAAGLQPEDFEYLSGSQCTSLGDDVDEAHHFDLVLAAFKSMGVDANETSEVLNTMMAVLHIGNIEFEAPATNSEGSQPVGGEEADSVLAGACRLLGVEPSVLSAACCTKTRTAPGEGVIRSPVTTAKAAESRDALARYLYGAIFALVVQRVNAALKVSADTDHAALPFVGVLDIFGFEFFQTNSLEQLFINFTNELLQQYFNEVIFEHEAALYTREGIEWDPLDFPNNSGIVELVSKGVLPMLDEECLTVGGSSEGWCSKLQKTYNTSKHFKVVKHRQGNFIVQHFAGPVEYNSEEFLVKNRDLLSADVVQCMKASSSSFMRQRFLEQDRFFGSQEATTTSGARKKARQYSVSSEFRGQLQSLMTRIRSTEPHFVRCIKPNPRSVANEFNRASVVEQLQYQGVLQAIEVSRAGYPMRLRHRQAVLEFRCLAPPQTKLQLEAQIARGKLDSAARLLFSSLENGAVRGLSERSWAVGNTLVFLKKDGIEVIGTALLRLRHKKATQVQAAWHCIVQRRRYQQLCRAIRRLEVAVRGFLARRRVARLRRRLAATCIQSVERGRRARIFWKRAMRAIKVIQAAQRARGVRASYLRSNRLLRRLQLWVRRRFQRQIFHRRWVSALTLQRTWRGHCGRLSSVRTFAARHRRRLACRRLLKQWRLKVCTRLLRPPSAGVGSGVVLSAEQVLAVRLSDASCGALLAATAAIEERKTRTADELIALRLEHRRLLEQVRGLERWTFTGILIRLMRTIFGQDCAGGPEQEQDRSLIPKDQVEA